MIDASDYFLTEDELKTRFEERVLDYVFGPYHPQAHPVLVLVGAQQAAGKSQAMARARQRHASNQLVPLTGDELRFLHPRHDEIMAEQPWLFLEATGQATAHWVKWSIEHALRERYSLILEGVFRDPAMPLATARQFAPTHSVEVVGLAVPEEVSRLDGEYRFLEGGRWTPPELHDLSYRMMPETIRVLASSPAVRRVTITDRSGADLHVLDKTTPAYAATNDTESATAAAAAVVDLRSRPLTAEEAQAWMNRQRDTVTTYAVRGAIDDTSRPTLARITHEDAARIMPMAAPDPAGQLRKSYEATQPLLQLLVTDALQPLLPLRLQTEDELHISPSPSGQQRQETEAELARRAAQTPPQRAAEDLVRRQLHPARAAQQLDPDTQAALDTLAAQTPRSEPINQRAPATEPTTAAATGPAVQPTTREPDNSPGLG